jgi:thiamine biosynthesis lipoprotein
MTLVSFEFEAIGTHWKIDFDNTSVYSPADIEAQIRNRIDIFDKVYSRFREDSLVTQISKQAGEFEFPEDAEKLFSIYKSAYLATNGLVTPLIGNVISDAGYDANYSLVPKNVTSPYAWEEVLTYNHPVLEVKQKVILDFGAAGKGYLVDIVGELLLNLGINNFFIDAGSDMLTMGEMGEDEKIGLEDPENFNQVIGVVQIKNQSLCASAGNRRKWDKYTHIINPKTLESPKNILATWVVADEAIVADALATCLFFVNPEDLVPQFKFEHLILYTDRSVNMSNNFPAQLFT